MTTTRERTQCCCGRCCRVQCVVPHPIPPLLRVLLVHRPPVEENAHVAPTIVSTRPEQPAPTTELPQPLRQQLELAALAIWVARFEPTCKMRYESRFSDRSRNSISWDAAAHNKRRRPQEARGRHYAEDERVRPAPEGCQRRTPSLQVY